MALSRNIVTSLVLLSVVLVVLWLSPSPFVHEGYEEEQGKDKQEKEVLYPELSASEPTTASEAMSKFASEPSNH